MKWESLFTQLVLLEGQKLFKQDLVKIRNRERTLFTALVGSNPEFAVTANLSVSPPLMQCTCPHAKKGSRCKHMAALLYELDATGELDDDEEYDDFDYDDNFDDDFDAYRYYSNYNSKNNNNSSKTNKNNKKSSKPAADKQKVERVYPFQHDNEDEAPYRYFNLSRITESLAIYSDVLSEAENLVSKDSIKLHSFRTGYPNTWITRQEDPLLAEIHTVSDQGTPSAHAVFGCDGIESLECRTWNCANDRFRKDSGQPYKICVHQAALLLLANRYIERENPGDNTDRNAENFLLKFRKTSIHQETKDEGVLVTLTPKLEVNHGTLLMSFRIGASKSFVLKKLSQLVDCVEGKEKLKLGKTEILDFMTCRFTEQSQRYYNLIRWFIESGRQWNAGYYSPYGERSMPLEGRILDDFFEITKGSKVDFVPSKYQTSMENPKESMITVDDGVPDVQITIEPDIRNDTFHGIIARGDIPTLLSGTTHKYYVSESALLRITDDVGESISLLADLTRQQDNVLFRVGRKNLSEFYYTVLPQLREHVDVIETDPEIMEKYIPPEVSFSFYLDYVNKNITCTAWANYGETRHSVLDCISQNHFVLPKEAYRDGYREQNVISTITNYLQYLSPEGEFHCDGDEAMVYEFMQSGTAELMHIGIVNATERFKRLRTRRTTNISVGVSVESGIMDLEILSSDVTNEELMEILESYRLQKKYHRLRNGDFVALDDEAIEALNSILTAMHLTPKDFVEGKMHIPAYRSLYLDKLLEENEELYTNRDTHFKQLIREFKTVGDSDFEIPDTLKPIMRNYQVYGFRWLRTLEANGFGGILADDMGLGKTLQMISVLEADKLEHGNKKTSIIVVPASLVFNWEEEFNKFAPDLKVCTITGTQAERKKKINAYKKYDALITSYDLLKRDIKEYEDITFDYEVIDEAQYIKNRGTSAAKSVKALRSKAHIALTGTPIENRLSELWSIFDFLMPGYLYNYETFRKEYETPIAKNGDKEASDRLKKMVSPFILRRLKKDVLRDLPDKIEEIRYAKFDREQRVAYDGQVAHMNAILTAQDDEDFNKKKLQILAELTRIRQICCDPSLLFADYNGGSAKRELCMEMIRNAKDGEHKTLVFSQFTSMLELLEHDLSEEEISYYKITGDTKKQERLDLVKKFNEDKTPVFLISLKAGGVGLNLTGADIVIHYDPWWNLAAQNQATDRAHRIGQQKVVSVYKLIVKDTIEEKIVKMQESKKELADEILSGETGGLVGMSKEDLLQLLQG